MKACFGVLVIILIATKTICCESLPSGNTTKKFHLITTSKANWYHALHHCIANGMRMASILSKEENDQVVKQIRDAGFVDNFWIGGTRLGSKLEPEYTKIVNEHWRYGSERYYFWMGQNEAISFSDWFNGEPNNYDGKESCLQLKGSYNYKWNDEECTNSYNFVCEEEIVE